MSTGLHLSDDLFSVKFDRDPYNFTYRSGSPKALFTLVRLITNVKDEFFFEFKRLDLPHQEMNDTEWVREDIHRTSTNDITCLAPL